MKTREEWGYLDATERAEAVGELYFRGLSVPAIAKQLGAPWSEVRHFIDIIAMSAYKSDRMEAFFENLQQRTMEHITALDAQIEITYFELDAARERVVALDEEGFPLVERDPRTGAPTQKLKTRPRSERMIAPMLSQLERLHRQKADVLKIINQKSDMTVKLQISHQIQNVILEYIQTLSPEVYAELHRQISAIVPSEMMTIDEAPKSLVS